MLINLLNVISITSSLLLVHLLIITSSHFISVRTVSISSTVIFPTNSSLPPGG